MPNSDAMTARQRRFLWVSATVAAILCTFLYLLAPLLRDDFELDPMTLTVLVGWQLSLLGLHSWREMNMREPQGQALVEYVLLLGLIVIVVLVAAYTLGPVVAELFSNANNRLP